MPYRLNISALVASGFGSDPLAMAVDQRINERLLHMVSMFSHLFPVLTDEEWGRLPTEAQRCFVLTSDTPRTMVDHHPPPSTLGSGSRGGQALPGQVHTVGSGGVAGSNQAAQAYVSTGQYEPSPPPFIGVQQGAQQAPTRTRNPPNPANRARPPFPGAPTHTDTEPEDL